MMTPKAENLHFNMEQNVAYSNDVGLVSTINTASTHSLGNSKGKDITISHFCNAIKAFVLKGKFTTLNPDKFNILLIGDNMVSKIYRYARDDRFMNGVANDLVGGLMKSYADKCQADLKKAADILKKFYIQGDYLIFLFFVVV